MVKYKYNLLHLTLANDEGWRVEIKALPKLTSVGAWNVKTRWYIRTILFHLLMMSREIMVDYLTRMNDVKELVQYAKDYGS